MLYNQNPKIALLIIGDEILSGRTLDKNTQYIAQTAAKFGIELKEVRVIPDNEDEIVTAVNLLRAKYDYLFTTGGIGPTHDDITAESVAKAFGVKVVQNQQAFETLVKYYGGEDQLNPGRTKMACVPEGAGLIDNPVSGAPGFIMENVYVMAGVPRIMQSMLDGVLPGLKHGAEVQSATVQVHAGESKIAAVLTDLQARYKHIAIGSYPYMQSDGYDKPGTNIIFRCVDADEIAKAVTDFASDLKALNVEFDNK